MSKTNVMTMEEYKKKMSRKGSKKNFPEHDEQVRLFEWAELMSNKYPELEMLMAIPNGAYYGGHWSVANRMKAEGVKKGVPDVFLPIPILDVANEKMKAGLWIEMKYGKNKTSENQDWWIEKLDEYGYEAHVCYGADEAIEVISKYLNISEE